MTLIAITTLRERIGLADTDGTRDADIIVAHDIALAMIENYCDRKFALATDTEQFTHRAAYSFSLRRYPVTSITSVTDLLNPTVALSYHVDEDTGTLFMDGRTLTHKLTVVYEGGYDETTIPKDLQWVLLHLFDIVWADMENAGGGALVTGPIKQAKIGDLSLSYDTSSSSALGIISDSFITAPLANILFNYKRWYV